MVYNPSYEPNLDVIDCGLYAVEITGEVRQHVCAVWLKFGSVYPALGPGWYVKTKKGGGGK